MYLVPGSSLYHGSLETIVGGAADGRMNDLWTWVGHQAMVSAIGSNSSIINDISRTPRPRTSIEVTEDLRDMFLNQDVTVWGEMEKNMSIPKIQMGWCGIISTVLSLLMRCPLVIAIAERATSVIDG